MTKSFSPKLHGNLGNYSYKLLSMNAEDFDLFMKFKPFKGINVTMPYKEKALAFCSVLSDEASGNRLRKYRGKEKQRTLWLQHRP